MNHSPSWLGIATDLLARLDKYPSAKGVPPPFAWLRAAKGMSTELRRLKPDLQLEDVVVVFHELRGRLKKRIIDIKPVVVLKTPGNHTLRRLPISVNYCTATRYAT